LSGGIEESHETFRKTVDLHSELRSWNRLHKKQERSLLTATFGELVLVAIAI
jgi:hypothetical protein